MSDERIMRQSRSAAVKFQTREDGGELFIEGYFSVFNTLYKLWEGAEETVLPGAFTDTLKEMDVRALTNHDDTLVLGRTSAKTLELNEDEKGLFGRIKINREDVDAMNLYARIQRGDVDQCSFGFDIEAERFEENPDGSVRWSIERVKLYEVSVVTFPAYEDTFVQARKKDFEGIQGRKKEQWCSEMRKKLKGEQ